MTTAVLAACKPRQSAQQPLCKGITCTGKANKQKCASCVLLHPHTLQLVLMSHTHMQEKSSSSSTAVVPLLEHPEQNGVRRPECSSNDNFLVNRTATVLASADSQQFA